MHLFFFKQIECIKKIASIEKLYYFCSRNKYNNNAKYIQSMKNTVLVQAKVPLAVKESSEKILNDFGLDISTAIRMFLIKVKDTQSIPFSIGYENNGVSKELSDYLLAAKRDIEQDKNVLHFSDNQDGFSYLESLMK
jgi:addiction module RelB/DinJ family antitoxin